MTTFGGATVPPLFVNTFGGGVFSYQFVGASSILSVGDSSTLNNDQRTITDIPGGALGDLLVGFGAAGPGYGGQASLFWATPTFGTWSPTGGVLIISSVVSRVVCRIAPRYATNDDEDHMLVFGIGPFPLCSQVLRFTGSIFSGPLSGITSDNEDSEILPDADFQREVGQPGPAINTLKCFLSTKQAAAAQDSVTVSGVDQGITQAAGVNTGDNGFDDGMFAAWGYKFENVQQTTPAGDWGLSASHSSDVYSVSCTFRSDDG